MNSSIDLKFKKVYNNYGTHYYGWKMVVNQFINMVITYYNNNINEELNFDNKIFFDEWIEKFLIWGNKIEKQKILDKINKKNYDIITFIHNPPYLKYYEVDNLNKIQEQIILSDDLLLNKNLFDELSINNIDNRIKYLYTFSISHKIYIYNNYPTYRNKIVSIYHPIDIYTEPEKSFNFNLFILNKKIIHIGWWLRNFKTFIDFKLPVKYSKNFLIKNDFKDSWDIFSKKYDISDINILENLTNSDYENIFKEACIFIDLEDCVANNTILECIKFNTPIITRRHPSVEEYIGKDYPLFFETNTDLLLLNNANYLDDNILKAHNYLVNMNKSHISLNTFNNKLIYDIHKLKNNNNNLLTWCCFIFENINKEQIDNFIRNFNNQTCLDLLYLKFFINEKIYNNTDIFNIELKIHINTILGSNKNISLIIINDENDENDENIFNICLENIQTEYFNIVNINDIFHNDYSQKHIEFLNLNVNCDITITSYTLINSKKNKISKIIYNNNKMIFFNKLKKNKFVLSGIIWRAKIFEIIHLSLELDFLNNKNSDNIRSILYNCITNNLNIINISDNPDMLIKIII